MRTNQSVTKSTSGARTLLRRGAVASLALTASLTSFVLLQAAPASATNFVQPADPTTNVLPAISLDCNNAIDDTSAACTNSSLYDIDVGRADEGLGPLILPSNYSSLTQDEQNLALVNLERTARGLPAEYGLANCMNADAQAGSIAQDDPVDTNCSEPLKGEKSNWSNTPSPIETDFLLVYDDGMGSPNIKCTATITSGCWGHRENILNVVCNNVLPGPCTYVMGAAATGETGQEFGFFLGSTLPGLTDDNTGMSFLNSSIDYATTAAPQILSLGNASGSSGATLSVNGIYFTGATSVQFGSPTCAAVPTVVNDTQVTVTVPVCALGSVSVVVVTPSGSSNGSPFTAEHSDPYSSLAPVRICDTRPNNVSNLSGDAAQCNGTSIPAQTTLTINVANHFGIPANATAVVLNVTVVNPAAAGYMTVYPAGVTMPTASNVNFPAGAAVPNLVEVGTGTAGDVSFFSSVRADLVVDVEGYTAPTPLGGTGSGLYDPLPAPVRICDSRPPSSFSPVNQCTGHTITPGGTDNVQVTGANTIPAGAIAAVFNVTVVNPVAGGYLTVYPEGGTAPTASNVNYAAGETTANRVMVPLSAGGGISVFSSQRTDVLVDVSGYYTASGMASTGSQFSAEAAPVRICDTRAVSSFSPHNECSSRTLASAPPGQTLVVPVIGSPVSGVPVGATAVVVNLTGIAPTQSTFLTVFPGPTLPGASDLNPAAGTTDANLVVATLSHNGTISIYNNTGNIDVIVDVLGWYS
jgi:hypothetical protein